MLILMPSIAFSQIYEAFVVANSFTMILNRAKDGMRDHFHVLVRHENSLALQRWVDDHNTDRKVPPGTAERFFRPAGLAEFVDLKPSVKTLGYYH